MLNSLILSFSSVTSLKSWSDDYPLHAAAASGDESAVERLFRTGSELDLQDKRGRTALHIAVRYGRFALAANLLTLGASHEVVDATGRKALDPSTISPAALHSIRQHYKRIATIDLQPSTAEAAMRLEQLERDGIVKLEGLVSPVLLSQLRSDFEEFVINLDQQRANGRGAAKRYDEEEHWWPEDLAYVTNNAFKYSRQLAELCCDRRVVELANLYLRQPAHITRAVAMRYLPHTARTNDMFGWHHDLEDKRFKMLVLLTDLDKSGQVMSYVKGSHRLRHSYKMFFQNDCPLKYCQRHLKDLVIVDTVGKAGDVFVFDSNGAHRGNRRPTAPTRDTFFIEYDSDTSEIWGADVASDTTEKKIYGMANPLSHIASAEKMWERTRVRKLPSWLENLPHVDRWRAA